MQIVAYNCASASFVCEKTAFQSHISNLYMELCLQQNIRHLSIITPICFRDVYLWFDLIRHSTQVVCVALYAG